MIKLKKEVNKSAIMRELRKAAEKKYERSWQPELQVEAFMKGAETLLKLLSIADVSNSSKTKANKKEPTTPYSEWCKKLKDI